MCLTSMLQLYVLFPSYRISGLKMEAGSYRSGTPQLIVCPTIPFRQTLFPDVGLNTQPTGSRISSRAGFGGEEALAMAIRLRI